MNIKVVAVFLVCACIIAEARPPGRGRSGDRGSGSEHKNSRPHGPGEADGRGRAHNDTKPEVVTQTVRQLKKLCDGLNNGNITSDNSSYNDVFIALGGVCADLVTYLDSQAVSTQAPVQDPAAVTDRRGPKGSSRAHGGEQGGKLENKGHRENKHEYNGNKARVELFKSCMWLERIQANLPADLSADLVTIFTKMEAVCTAADLVRNTVPVVADVTTPAAQ